MAEAGGNYRNISEYHLAKVALDEVMLKDPFRRYDVHGIGIGYKETNGRKEDRLALCFFLACKIPSGQLPHERRIPSSIQIFSDALGQEVEVVTDVIESPPGSLMSPDPESRLRPVPGGVSCSAGTTHGTGTMGGWVWDNTDDTIVMLSNYHVFGGDAGTEIIQPGRGVGQGDPQDRIGQVKRGIPIKFYTGRPQPSDCNFVDAAIGEIDNSDLFDLTVLQIGAAVYQISDPIVGESVEKMGQKTGHTFGEVTHANCCFSLNDYGADPVAMCDCFRIVPTTTEWFSDHGDSGSIVFRQVTQDSLPTAVGLLFYGGGPPPHNWALSCKIGNVFNLLDLGPLCEGGCQAFFDALYADNGSDNVAPGRHRSQDVAPLAFTRRERLRQRARRFHTGLTKDLQARVMTGMRGRALLRFIDKHRSELLTLIVKDGDTRRAMVSALRPILAGAVTTTDVLRLHLTAQDLSRLEALGHTISDKGSNSLCQSVDVLRGLLKLGTGRSVAEILEVCRKSLGYTEKAP